MLNQDLSVLTGNRVEVDLKARGIAISPTMKDLLAALATRNGCWKNICTATVTWLAASTPQEVASVWASVVSVCNDDQRPTAAFPLLYAQRADAHALKTAWLGLPVNTLPALRVFLAANPLLRVMFSDPASGVTGLPTELADDTAAATIWTKISGDLTKISQFTG